MDRALSSKIPVGTPVILVGLLAAMLLGCKQRTFHDSTKTKSVPAGECGEPLPQGGFRVDGQYIWDSWLIAPETNNPDRLFRYALTAPANVKTHERHDLAKVRYAESLDRGKSWTDKGIIVQPNQNGTWPDHIIWTGQTMIIDGRWYMWFTGRSKGDYFPGQPRSAPRGSLQKIGLAVSDNGSTWGAPEMILDGTTEVAKQLGYDTTEDDGVFSAFRDPMVIKDEDFQHNGKLHMVFATKQRIERNGKTHILPTVGYATSIDKANGFKKWTLQKPLELPHYGELTKYALGASELGTAKIRQVEVPYLVKRASPTGKNYTYLFFSTQRRPEENTNDLKEAAFRGYVSESGIRGPFKPVYGSVSQGKIPFTQDADKIYGSEIYASTIFELPTSEGKIEYYSSTFFSEETKWPLTLTPLYPIRWEDDTTPPAPFFSFPRGSSILASKNCASGSR